MSWRTDEIRKLSQEERWHLLALAAIMTKKAVERQVEQSGFQGTARIEFRRLLFKGYKLNRARRLVAKWVERKNQ